MLYEAFLLAAHMASVGAIHREDAFDLAIEVIDVVLDTDDSFTGSKEKDVQLLVTWVARESAGKVHVIGDKGASNGAMQIGQVWFDLCQTNKEKLITNRRENIACGYKIMKHLRGVCGSVRSALRSYASGPCQGSIEARQKVESRCKESGAC